MIRKSEKVLQYELPLTLKRQRSGGYLATCALWSDCYAQGDTIDETVLEATAVAQALIELYTEEGLKIPLKQQKEQSIGYPLITVPVFVSA